MGTKTTDVWVGEALGARTRLARRPGRRFASEAVERAMPFAARSVICFALVAASLGLVVGMARAQAPSTGGASRGEDKVFEMTAEEVTYRGKDGVTIAEGKVVVSYGSIELTGDYAEYNDRVPCVLLRSAGKVTVRDAVDKTVLTAGEVVFYLNEEKLDASGGATLNYQGGRAIASGDRLTYLGKERKGIVMGNARVEMGRKSFAAASITVLFDEESVIATGGTRTVIPGGEIAPPGGPSSGKG